MLSVFIIIFREVLEISMILGVVIAMTRGLKGRRRWISAGLAGGLLGSGIVAYFTGSLSNALDGMGQEVFNAVVLILAAGLISWTVLWMKRHSAHMIRELKQVGQSVIAGDLPLHMLAVVVGLAMLREGSEIVLFVYGALASGTAAVEVLTGFSLGLIAGAAIGAALYFGLLSVSPKHFFAVTGILLIFLAAGMLSQSVGLLSSIGWINVGTGMAWDTSAFLSEQQILGEFAHALFGYTSRPSGIQAAVYFTTVIVLLSLNQFQPKNKKEKVC